MNSFSLDNLLRENIKKVKPYSSARDEYKGKEGIFLDANENPFGSSSGKNFNRYPDPLQSELKDLLSKIKRVEPENIFIGNGSDEPIDLITRMVCNPGKDNVIITPPTYGMYEVSSGINDVAIKEVPLTEDFHIRPEAILAAADKNTKIIWLCSPNNPTGNALKAADVKKVISGFSGLVVVDEAYIDFAPEKTFLRELKNYPNLIILQTLSKAWGMANLRLGMAFASQEIIKILNKIKPPYNINGQTQELAAEGLKNILAKEMMVQDILMQRDLLNQELKTLPLVKKIYPSDANFILLKVDDPSGVFNYLIKEKIITRDRSKVLLCEGCIRVSVGTESENRAFIESLKKYKK